MKLVDKIVGSLGLDTLIGEVYEIALDGYKRGIIVGAQQLKPLNVKIETNLMGKNLTGEKLKRIKDLNEKYINTWADRFGKQVYDVVYDGLENGRTIKEITDTIRTITDKGVIEARKSANAIIVDASRRGEIDLYRETGVELGRWITVGDNKVCGVCNGLSGRIYKEGYDEQGLINYDTKAFLTEDIAELSEANDLQDWIDPDDGANGPPIHYFGLCRCHLAPVLTFEQYKGNIQVNISEV